jgi:DNA-binding NtrC family response regulator
MRSLLVLSADPLDENIGDLLRRDDWRLVQVHDADQAGSLAEANGFSVGLAVFPRDADDGLLRAYEGAIRRLPGIKWIAAVTQSQVERGRIKSLIAERVYDYQILPLDGARLSFALGHAYGMARIERELHEQREPGESGRFGLIGNSRAMRILYAKIERAAACDATALVSGGTGTGKEQVAKAIHAHSSRANGPFVALNCAAIPPSLMQSELFGYEKGAFTHASGSRRGHIEAASGGTLLLDEIGELPPDLQASLLRFLDNHVVTRLGSSKARKVDVRIIAATNRDLQRMVKTGVFRSDLYYRLAVLTIRTPSLKGRGEDLFLLADHFLREAMNTTGIVVSGFDAGALEGLRNHAWPGNLRELRNKILQALLRSSGPLITREDLNLAEHPGADLPESLHAARDKAEREALEKVLERTGWNMSSAAKRLKISRMTLYRLVEKHGLMRED